LDSDLSIRWQVMRDLTDEPDDVVAAERSRVASEGWGARLLDLQAPDGEWGGGSYHPYWTSTHYTLLLLRDLGLDPAFAEGMVAGVRQRRRRGCRDGVSGQDRRARPALPRSPDRSVRPGRLLSFVDTPAAPHRDEARDLLLQLPRLARVSHADGVLDKLLLEGSRQIIPLQEHGGPKPAQDTHLSF
jgi:hypothetical protein